MVTSALRVYPDAWWLSVCWVSVESPKKSYSHTSGYSWLNFRLTFHTLKQTRHHRRLSIWQLSVGPAISIGLLVYYGQTTESWSTDQVRIFVMISSWNTFHGWRRPIPPKPGRGLKINPHILFCSWNPFFVSAFWWSWSLHPPPCYWGRSGLIGVPRVIRAEANNHLIYPLGSLFVVCITEGNSYVHLHPGP